MARTNADIYDSVTNAQSPDEFLATWDRNPDTLDDYVTAYVDDLPRMFEEPYTDDELGTIAAAMLEYLTAYLDAEVARS